MSDKAPARPGDETAAPVRPRAFDTIFYGGLAVGVLDGLDALVFFGLRGSSPTGIFQYIASGLLGRAAFAGGLKTALLGVLLHFLIAFILAAIYYGLSLRFPALLRRPFVWGPAYGVAAHLVMSFVVTPLSAAPPLPYPLPVMLNGVLGHALLVGLPIALIARRSAAARRGERRSPDA
jgi:hypothetical protein